MTLTTTSAADLTGDDWSLAARAQASLSAIRARGAAPAKGQEAGGAPAARDASEASRRTELDGICETLRQTDIFANLSERRLRHLARGCSPQALPKNRHVFRCGDPSDAVFVVCEGSVDVLRDQRGKPLQRLARLNAGDIFGELGVLHGVERGASVRTATACRLLRIGRQTFRHFLEDNAATEARLEALATRRHCHNTAAVLDSRKDARIRVDAPVVLIPAAERHRLTHLEDISNGGLSITGVPAGWTSEQPVSFTLIAGKSRLCLTGRVVWRQGGTIGVAFTGDIPGHSHRIARFTRALLDELT